MSDRSAGVSFRRATAAFAVVPLAILTVVLFWPRPAAAAPPSPEHLWRSLSWRAQIFLRKAEGEIPGLSWTELWQMERTPGGFDLQSVVDEGRSIEAGLVNPFITPKDHAAGARIFSTHCAVCHGIDATGLRGPSLVRRDFKFGDSDLAIYKVLRDGIAGTAMAPTGLSFLQRWQVIGYLRTLQAQHVPSAAAARRDIHVSSDELRNPASRPGEWLTYSRALDGRRYSPLGEITAANIAQLRLRWVHQFASDQSKFEATPLVVDNTIFTVEPPATVVALNARSGDEIWRYRRTLPGDLSVCCGSVNRGLAILGHVLYFGSLDGYLVAIDADDGKVLWQTEVASAAGHYTITGAPLIVDHSVVVGVSGGEYGIRGFLAAYDAATGRRQWRFYTIPGPGEPGHETWGDGDAWRTGGGPTWVTGSYDPSLDLLYWGVGNPSPVYAGEARPGDNLYTNSVIALNGHSGKLAWHFQFTPHDQHDWDSSQTPVLADLVIDGAKRKVVCWANRNGIYYVLDRTTGKLLTAVPFVKQNWEKGFDSSGRPIATNQFAVTPGGRLTWPGILGGRNWQPSAFDPEAGSYFVEAAEGSSVFTNSKTVRRGAQGLFLGSGFAGGGMSLPVMFVRALDAATGARRWQYRPKQSFDQGGLLATAGGLVFGTSGGTLFALRAATGEEVWRVALGGETWAPPISFALDGRQMIAVSAGRAFFVFGL